MTASSPRTATTLIAATGTAELRVPPDRATLHVAIRTADAESLREAARRSAPIERDVLAALAGAGVPRDRVSTIRYDTGRERLYEDKEWVHGDYYVDHVLAADVHDLERIGAVIAAARGAGAARIAGIHFWLSTEEDVRERATRAAVAQAFARARTLAESAGATLGPVVRLGTPEALAATLGAGAERGGGYAMRIMDAAAPSMPDDDEDIEPVILPVPITVDVIVHGAWEVVLEPG